MINFRHYIMIMLLLLPGKDSKTLTCCAGDIMFLFQGQCEVQAKAKALKVLSNKNILCLNSAFFFVIFLWVW